MAEVIWTDNAIEDLNDIGEYIARDSERYAQITVQKLFNAVDILETHPRKGFMVPEFRDKNIRQIIIDNYRIVYQFAENSAVVHILTVHYSTRLLTNTRHFKKE